MIEDTSAPVGVLNAPNTEDDDQYALKKLVDELKTQDKDTPKRRLPKRLKLSAIECLPELFQMRLLNEQHIGDLVRAIKTHKQLEAVTVRAVGSKFILIDGHHRCTAYGRAGVTKDIPVQHYSGSIADAVLAAGRANSKAKLPMTTAQRQDFAWRLVLLDAYSKKGIVEAACVGDGQVAKMRRAKIKLGAEAHRHTRWWSAMRAANGSESVEVDDDWLESQALHYAERLRKEFKDKLASNPDMAARVLALHFGNNLGGLVAALRGQVSKIEIDNDDARDF